jgi:hypothetical protein
MCPLVDTVNVEAAQPDRDPSAIHARDGGRSENERSGLCAETDPIWPRPISTSSLQGRPACRACARLVPRLCNSPTTHIEAR